MRLSPAENSAPPNSELTVARGNEFRRSATGRRVSWIAKTLSKLYETACGKFRTTAG